MDTVEKNQRILNLERALDEITTVRGAPQAATATALVSVVIPCFGQLEYTRLCVPSLLRHSRQPCELIFVDGESLDGTAEYLAGLCAASVIPVTVIRATEEAGMPAAFDKGICAAKGRFIVLLSNDTIVTSTWLSQLTALADADSGIGAAGPMSNRASHPQWVGAVPYRAGARIQGPTVPEDALDEFAREWRAQHKGKWFETDHLDSFCILFKREVLVAIGPLERLCTSSNSRSRPSIFDLGDVSPAIRRSGTKMACCYDLFIHSFGSRGICAPRPE
jgi:GT2 family glycosyltransferase